VDPQVWILLVPEWAHTKRFVCVACLALWLEGSVCRVQVVPLARRELALDDIVSRQRRTRKCMYIYHLTVALESVRKTKQEL
jgi:hypothetical protein